MTVDCSFCQLDPSKHLFSNDLAIVIADGFPVSRGHSLLIPRRHFPSLFEASEEERAALWKLLDQTRDYLMTQYRPDGFNIGINDGISAGQTVMHLHIHLIPRYSGDTADPRGGIRWIMPDMAPYWRER
ncbi:MAG: HIT family protein [Thermodesulfobacteriota bacterium]|nr:HIT family protein [Thermodesulfobacteriota bacterium]